MQTDLSSSYMPVSAHRTLRCIHRESGVLRFSEFAASTTLGEIPIIPR